MVKVSEIVELYSLNFLIWSTFLSLLRDCHTRLLNLNVPYISGSCIEIKIRLNFYFHTSFGASKGFMKALKAFIKPFEAPQRSVKIKI